MGGTGMTQNERRLFLIQYLRHENPVFGDLEVPEEKTEQETLLRAMMNVRCPEPIGEEFLSVQDAYLKERILERGIVDASFFPRLWKNCSLWRGDSTRVKADGIVNAANRSLEGCYHANHNCIDNAIHTFSGVQLRLLCSKLVKEQGREEREGECKVTPAFNLPSSYILHTVGPCVEGPLEEEHCKALASCYRSVLEEADRLHLTSLALCSISTGVFGFPIRKAAEIALTAVEDYRKQHGDKMQIIFCVYSEEDEGIYRELLLKAI